MCSFVLKNDTEAIRKFIMGKFFKKIKLELSLNEDSSSV